MLKKAGFRAVSRTSTSRRRKTRSTNKKHYRSRTRAEVRNAVPCRNSEQISKLLNWLLPDDRLFADLKLHGNTSWLPRTLASLRLCWAWAENRCLTDSFTYAAGWMHTLAGEGVVLTTYQGMMNALSKWTPSLLTILQQRFQRLMKQIGKDRWAVGDWVATGWRLRSMVHAMRHRERNPTNGRIAPQTMVTAKRRGPRRTETARGEARGKHGASSAAGFARLDHTDVARGPSTSVDVASGAIEHE